jgi:hypothetical protein
MKNYARRADADDEISAELTTAGIESVNVGEWFRTSHPQMRTVIVGQLGPWTFRRAWYYWIASGPGLPPRYANALHETHGNDVRVDGNCTCPSPLDQNKGFATGLYHVHTADGLKALADALRRCMAEAREPTP